MGPAAFAKPDHWPRRGAKGAGGLGPRNPESPFPLVPLRLMRLFAAVTRPFRPVVKNQEAFGWRGWEYDRRRPKGEGQP